MSSLPKSYAPDLGPSSRRASSNDDADALKFRPSFGIFDLYGQNIHSQKVRPRVIEHRKCWSFQCQALLIVCEHELRLLNGDLAMLRRRAQLDRRERARRAIPPHVRVDSNTNIRIRLPIHRTVDRLDLPKNRRVRSDDDRSPPQQHSLHGLHSTANVALSNLRLMFASSRARANNDRMGRREVEEGDIPATESRSLILTA